MNFYFKMLLLKLLCALGIGLVLSDFKDYIFPLYDIIYRPFYFLMDMIQKFLTLIYIALGLLFLIFLIDKEFPSFRVFVESMLKVLKILK